MAIYELNEEQLNSTKEQYYIENVNNEPSYGELLESHNIPDSVVYNYYDGCSFSEGDFSF